MPRTMNDGKGKKHLVKVRRSNRRSVEIIEADGQPTRPEPWSAKNLYARSSEFRRILFLEMVAWTINRVEAFETDKEAKKFFLELRENRRVWWGERPWPGAAKDEERFLSHVRDLAEVFANAPSASSAYYAARLLGPLT